MAPREYGVNAVPFSEPQIVKYRPGKIIGTIGPGNG